MPDPITPRYGTAALADLVPSLLAGLGVPGFADPLQIGPLDRAVLLVADGLGFELLRRHPDLAPFMTEHLDGAGPLSTGFPSTTAVSLSSIGTGLPPGEHGVVGYTMALPELPRAMNLLQWALHGKPAQDLTGIVVPETFFGAPTAFERAVRAGVSVDLVGPVELAHSGLTRSTLRGGRYRGARGRPAIVEDVVAALREGGPKALVYAYHPALDATGHAHGVESPEWREALQEVDRLAQAVANALPPDSLLAITGDHGMVDVPPGNQYDLADHPGLRSGVRLLGGEPRARHVYTRPGA
ncbi:MAG: alkaline phosphatase family protein, partial [Candidatus Dormibacteraceae bacterium]